MATNYRFLCRGGTAADLATVNEIPLKRELVLETDTDKFKFGDGVTAYNSLAYAGGGGAVDLEMRIDSGNLEFSVDGGTTWEIAAPVSAIAGPAGPPGPNSSLFPTADFDGGSGAIIVGKTCDLYVPFEFIITGWVILCEPSGTIVFDVQMDDLASFPPGPGDSICGGNLPEVITGRSASDNTLAGWVTTTVPAGSTLRFEPTAVTGVVSAQLMLIGYRP